MSIFIPLVFFGFLLILVLAAARMSSKLFGFVAWRKSAVFIGGYLVCLMLFVPLVALLPNNGFLKSGSIDVKENPAAGNIPYSNIRTKEDFNHQQGLHRNSSQTFKLERQTALSLKLSPESIYTQVFVERKPVADEKIDVLTYVTPYSIGGTDFTGLIEAPKVSLDSGLLSIQSFRQNFTFKLFKTDFTQSQFRNQESSNLNLSNPGAFNFGRGVVYLRIPENLDLEAGTNNVVILDNA